MPLTSTDSIAADPPVRVLPVATTAASLRPRGELASLLVLATIFFTVALDFVVMMPLGPQLMRVFHINTQQFNFAVSAYALAAGVSGLSAALFLDRFDRKRALLGLYAGFALGTLGCALAPSYGWLVGMRALAGVFGGVIGGVVLAIVGDTVPEARRGAAVGIVTAAFPVAQVLGVPLSLFAAGKLSWHVPFSGLALASVFVGVAAAFSLPRIRGHLRAAKAAGPESARAGLWAIVSEPNHLWAFALSAIITLSGFLVIPDLATFMVHNVGVDERHLPWLYAAGGACTLWTMPLAGRLSDRMGKATGVFRDDPLHGAGRHRVNASTAGALDAGGGGDGPVYDHDLRSLRAGDGDGHGERGTAAPRRVYERELRCVAGVLRLGRGRGGVDRFRRARWSAAGVRRDRVAVRGAVRGRAVHRAEVAEG